MAGSGRVAGPFATDPSKKLNLPWHGQSIVPSAPRFTVHSAWVQIADNPSKIPFGGRVSTMSSMITPDRGATCTVLVMTFGDSRAPVWCLAGAWRRRCAAPLIRCWWPAASSCSKKPQRAHQSGRSPCRTTSFVDQVGYSKRMGLFPLLSVVAVSAGGCRSVRGASCHDRTEPRTRSPWRTRRIRRTRRTPHPSHVNDTGAIYTVRDTEPAFGDPRGLHLRAEPRMSPHWRPLTPVGRPAFSVGAQWLWDRSDHCEYSHVVPRCSGAFAPGCELRRDTDRLWPSQRGRTMHLPAVSGS